MKKFKVWHLALIGLAVFLVFGGISAIIITSSDEYRTQGRWNVHWGEDNWVSLGDAESYNIDETDSIEITSATKAIELSSISADINITETTKEKIEVHLYGEYISRSGKIVLDIQNTGSTVKISVKYPKNSVMTSGRLVLDIQIPKDYNQDVRINNVSSDIDFDCRTLMLDSLYIKTVSGDSKLNTLHINSLSVESVSGDVVLTTIANPDLDMETVSGDVQITLEDDKEFYVDYSSVSGDFECDIPLIIIVQKRSSFEGHTGNKDAAMFEIDTVSGDFVIIEK